MLIEDYYSHTDKCVLLTCCTLQWELLINDLLFDIACKIILVILECFCYMRTIHSLPIIWMTHEKKREAFYFSYLLECWISYDKDFWKHGILNTFIKKSLIYFLSVHLIIKITVHCFLLLLAQQIQQKEHCTAFYSLLFITTESFPVIKPHSKP